MSKQKKDLEIEEDDDNKLKKHAEQLALFDAYIDAQILRLDEKKVEMDECGHYECIFTYEPMKDPHATTAGYSYEHDHIKEFLIKDGRDPQTRKPASHNQLYENKALRLAIEYFKSMGKDH